MNFENTRVPRELKQKETVIFHIPIIQRPITSRQLIYFLIGIFICIPFLFITKFILPVANNIEEKIIRSCLIVMFTLAIPVFFSILSLSKRDGIYLESRLFRKAKYNKNKKVLLNEKAARKLRD